MSSFNKWIGMGNLTRDPELRVTPNGTPLCNFSLACNRKYTPTGGGELREEVLYIDCEAWSKTGENIAKYCQKGGCLLIEGHLKLDQWEDKNTHEKRSKIKVVVGTFQFVGPRQGGASGAPAGAPIHDKPDAAGRFPTRPPAPAPKPAQEELDEDVPF